MSALGVAPTGGEGGAHNALFDADNLRKVTERLVAAAEALAEGRSVDGRRAAAAPPREVRRRALTEAPGGGAAPHFKTPAEVRADMARTEAWGRAVRAL